MWGLRARGGVGSLLSSFLLAARTRDPDTDDPGLVDLLRFLLSRFSFSLLRFSFFLLRLDELLVDVGHLLSFFSFLVWEYRSTPLGLSRLLLLEVAQLLSGVRPSSWRTSPSWVISLDDLLPGAGWVVALVGSGRSLGSLPSLQQAM